MRWIKAEPKLVESIQLSTACARKEGVLPVEVLKEALAGSNVS
ncbi:Uncharacterised protein [Chlamydia trachomatis]|nr:Uncharacterised protein [Chlamydia trachomatis]CRH70300.1 Uncharacterised protein [Chlamydia trachomatis]CRI74331.1 Uncharacterised protein [Chlamydia trachomatis]